MKYDALLRIPTNEPYAYLELKVTDTPEEIINAYLHFTRLYKVMAKTEIEQSKPPFN